MFGVRVITPWFLVGDVWGQSNNTLVFGWYQPRNGSSFKMTLALAGQVLDFFNVGLNLSVFTLTPIILAKI
jgi:hypothetical protein